VIVLGVDGGNTKTIALIVGADGAVLGKGRAGCADVHGIRGPAAAIDEIEAAVSAALASAAIRVDELAAAVFSLAGADWEEDFDFIRAELHGRLGIDGLLVVNDAIGLLRCGSATAVGVAVGVGTGAAIAARNSTGAVFHLGFWPDPMGGDALIRGALRATYRADLGLAPSTSLAARLCELFAAGSVAELRFLLNRRERSNGVVGRGIPSIVLDEADAGDYVASELVSELGRSLGQAARITADAVELESSEPLVLGGGVMSHPSNRLADGIAAAGGFDTIVRSRLQPVVGAVALAFDVIAFEPPLERLIGALPDEGYFATA
jgi:N-acetylglucosamine kinase-like BadF-type ATPase